MMRGPKLSDGLVQVSKIQRNLSERSWNHGLVMRSKLRQHGILVPLDKLNDLGTQSLLTCADVQIAQRKHILQLRAAHKGTLETAAQRAVQLNEQIPRGVENYADY